jgi:subtilase family serine protease
LSTYSGTFSQETATGTATCTNAGVNGAEGEAALDAEWAGTAAPDAAIVLASCKDTSTVFGGLIALQNLINGASPPKIVSISYASANRKTVRLPTQRTFPLINRRPHWEFRSL